MFSVQSTKMNNSASGNCDDFAYMHTYTDFKQDVRQARPQKISGTFGCRVLFFNCFYLFTSLAKYEGKPFPR